MRNKLVVSGILWVAALLLPGCATTAQDLQKQGLSHLTHGQLEMLMSRTRPDLVERLVSKPEKNSPRLSTKFDLYCASAR